MSIPSRNRNSFVAQALYASPTLNSSDTNDGGIIAVKFISDTTMSVANNLIVNNDITINGSVEIYDGIEIDGDYTLDGDITCHDCVISNDANTDTLSINGLFTLPGNRTIDDAITVQNVSVSRDLHVSGILDVNGDIHANSGLAIDGTLTVDDITINNDLNVSSDLEVNNITSATNESLSSGTISNITVLDNFSTNGNVTITATNKIVSKQNKCVTLNDSTIDNLYAGITLSPNISPSEIGVLKYVTLYYNSNGGLYYTLSEPDLKLIVSFSSNIPPDENQFGELIDLEGFIGFSSSPSALQNSLKVLRSPNKCIVPGESADFPIPTPSSLTVNDVVKIALSSGNLSSIQGSGGNLTISCWYDIIDFSDIS